MRNRILIVGDNDNNVTILRKVLKDQYELIYASNGEECLEKISCFEPDIILLDIAVPGLDGYETCRRIKSDQDGKLIQIILISTKASIESRVKGYEVGADDYIVNPFDHNELLVKVRVQLRIRNTLVQLSEQNTKLEYLVNQRTAEIVETRDVTVFALAKLAESRDPETGEHLERLRAYSQILAEQLMKQGSYTNEIDEQFLNELYRSSPLHDIGKVGISDAILLKSGQLTSSEFNIMKQHTIIGAEALELAAKHGKSGGFLDMGVNIARSHHEWFDGSGYPDGLSGRDIPLPARIVALADVYDAITSKRVYKSAVKPEIARKIIEQEETKHFDPQIVEVFRICWDDFLNVQPFVGDGNKLELVENTVHGVV